MTESVGAELNNELTIIFSCVAEARKALRKGHPALAWLAKI